MKRERQPQSNRFLWYVDTLKEKFSKIEFLDPKLLLTENRYDISLRIDFLNEVIKKKQVANKTKYFKFITDKDKGISRDPKNIITNFLNLYNDIKKNNMKNPILVGNYSSQNIWCNV